ncbi:MAG: aspartate 4-decarboxylase [Firmicutes bacterium]|nr:aspartate 4-decarboxylase [Bacillota bacterium]
MTQGMTQDRASERAFETISPFEFKNELIRLARQEDKKGARALLNAGRGNPNWVCATPRDAFWLLGQFATEECRRTWSDHDLAGKPAELGCADRLRAFLQAQTPSEAVTLLQGTLALSSTLLFHDDAFVHELTDGIIGDNYPQPDRMLVHTEQVVHQYLVQELCAGECAGGGFELFATEGATAAMCYLFDSFTENFLLAAGDRVAIMVPIFPPYVEIPHLAKYNFEVVEIRADALDDHGHHTWQYPDCELDKLRDKAVKALFLVNPSNPPSVALDAQARARIQSIVASDNPNLMIITDDVYSTFVEGFRSLMVDLPHNTACVYSFSKYFGVTGWRLGVIAIHRDNVFDKLIRDLDSASKRRLADRYASLSLKPESLRFVDRIVADSRQVALNHTAGISTVQQVQMALFCSFALLDERNRYKQQTRQICQRRMQLLYAGLGLEPPLLPNDADYYTQFDLLHWARREHGEMFAKFLTDQYEPVDVLFRLAERSGIVLLGGGGFYGPPWSIRVSLANLDDASYSQIGHDLRAVLAAYVEEWKQAQEAAASGVTS